MLTTRWQWTRAGAIVLATSLGGAAGAQPAGTSGYVELPPLQAIPTVLPAAEPSRTTTVSAAASVDGAACAGGCGGWGWGDRFRSAWERLKVRAEQKCVNQEPDPYPLGHSVLQHIDLQVTNGIAARMVVYDFDFEPGTAVLTARGREQVGQVGAWMMRYPFPAIVERPGYRPQLGEARQFAVQEELRRRKINVAAARVVVGAPPTAGISGVEANIMYLNLMNQTISRGLDSGAAANGGSGTDAVFGGGTQGTPGTR
jgi:hypothetical protein